MKLDVKKFIRERERGVLNVGFVLNKCIVLKVIR